jgi:hypothetical protein
MYVIETKYIRKSCASYYQPHILALSFFPTLRANAEKPKELSLPHHHPKIN